MGKKTYKISNSDVTVVVEQLLALCMQMQKQSDENQEILFSELLEHLSGLVGRLDQEDLKQVMVDLEKLTEDSLVMGEEENGN